MNIIALKDIYEVTLTIMFLAFSILGKGFSCCIK